MLRCWDSLAKGGLHHASRQGRVANVTDAQTVTEWEAAPVIAYVQACALLCFRKSDLKS